MLQVLPPLTTVPYTVILVYRPCIYITPIKLDSPFPLQSFPFKELSAALPRFLESAARIRGLRDFKGLCSGPVRPFLRSIITRTSVRSHLYLRFLWLSAAVPFPSRHRCIGARP
jgi:hypothetical protein